MERSLRIYFTSDTHGYLSPIDYATGKRAAAGVANCIANFEQDGNTLILDGGDTVQGSPFTYYLHKSLRPAQHPAAQLFNLGGYQFVTLGNHDFNYGQENLRQYLSQLDAKCLCANVKGLEGVEKSAIVTLKNGLRVGVVGITTSFIPVWEMPENLVGITVGDPVAAAAKELKALRAAGVDVTVGIYHGGFEADLETGALLSDTLENQGWRMCQELDFDVLLTGHQHAPLENKCIAGTYTAQPADKARHYVRMDVTVKGQGSDAEVSAVSKLCPAGNVTEPRAAALLAPLDASTAAWLDTPKGHLDVALRPASHIEMAADGSLIANFFNQVQLEASGAQLSATCLGNEVGGFDTDVTIRNVVSTYIYPNTLTVLEVDRAVLKAVLERSAAYFARDEHGGLTVSEGFLKPKVEHYNFDYISGIEADVDPDAPVGSRVTSIRRDGKELPADVKLTLAMNNYRATGTGGYDAYKTCPRVREVQTEIVEMIMDYIERHETITVDKTQWMHVKQ